MTEQNKRVYKKGGSHYIVYKGKEYTIRKGKFGSSYILVDGNKVYISQICKN